MSLVPDVDRVMRWDRYIGAIVDNESRALQKFAFDVAIEALEQMRVRFNLIDEVPTISVIRDESINAGVLYGLIQINTGLLQIIFDPPVVDSFPVLGLRVPKDLLSGFMLAWVFAHEYSHENRKHTTLEERFAGDPQVCQALEYDADMCATAALYREIQFYAPPGTPDISCREICIYSIYCILKALPSAPGSRSHMSSLCRIGYAMRKISSMNSASLSTGINEPDAAIYDEIMGRMVDLLIRLERGFCAANGHTLDAEAVLSDLLGDGDVPFLKWQEIRGHVYDVSGIRA